jgi:hypothetical protein
MYTAKAFFGRDEVAFIVVTNAPGAPGAARTYARFTDVVRDGIEVRILHGVHFRTADVHGAQLGQNVAEWIAARYFKPVPAPPDTGSGGALPGLPSTGAGGGTDRLSVGWLLLAMGGALAGGVGFRRRRATRRG